MVCAVGVGGIVDFVETELALGGSEDGNMV